MWSNFVEHLSATAEIVGYFSVIVAFAVVLIKPLRDKLGKTLNKKKIKRQQDDAQRDGIKCLLRQQMLKTYYHNKDSETIRQYELECFIMEYNAYKQLGGNSFIDEIRNEIIDWEIIN